MSDLMLDGLNLALYGMGFVFVFLLLLVLLTSLMSRAIGRYWPAAPVSVRRRSTQKSVVNKDSSTRSAADDARTVAIIAAAVKQHRSGSR